LLTIHKIDTQSKTDVNQFVDLPYRLYAGHQQWVPPPKVDARMFLNREKHPFYEHSTADFFIAKQDNCVVGRIAALENRRFNDYRGTKQAQFYLFECEDDQEVANALFTRVFEWAERRGLDTVVGPKGFSPFDGYGIQVEGFEHRQMMTMMNYNYEYYPRLVRNLGFEKKVDFVSCYISPPDYRLPDRVYRIIERVEQRGNLRVLPLRNKRDLRAWAPSIGAAYNKAFVNNWEYYPLTEREIDFVLETIMLVANPRLLKLILHESEVVGFLFAFPDISAALQRAKGRLLPFGIFDMLLEMRRTKWVSLNGVGILTKFQGQGGNALLYSEIEKTLQDFEFTHADITQVAESATQMRNDLENLGARPYKNHRVYARKV